MSQFAAAYFSMWVWLAPLVVCAGIGVVWGRCGQPFATDFVSKLVTYVAIPALVFHTLMVSPLTVGDVFEVLLWSTAALLVAGVFAAGLLRLLKLPGRDLGQTAWIPNAGNLGLPMAELAFGLEGLTVAIAFFTVSSLLSFTLGLRWLTGSMGQVWRQPVVWAVIAGLALRAADVTLPQWPIDSAHLVGSLAVPLMLLTLGYSLVGLPRSGLTQGAGVALVRYGSGLMAALLLWLALPEFRVAAPIALQLLMPCAVNSYLFARLHGRAGDVAAGAVLISTLAFLVFAPALLWFSQSV